MHVSCSLVVRTRKKASVAPTKRVPGSVVNRSLVTEREGRKEREAGRAEEEEGARPTALLPCYYFHYDPKSNDRIRYGF